MQPKENLLRDQIWVVNHQEQQYHKLQQVKVWLKNWSMTTILQQKKINTLTPMITNQSNPKNTKNLMIFTTSCLEKMNEEMRERERIVLRKVLIEDMWGLFYIFATKILEQ